MSFAHKINDGTVDTVAYLRPLEISENTYLVIAAIAPTIAVGIVTDWQNADWLACFACGILTLGMGSRLYAYLNYDKYFEPYRQQKRHQSN